MALDYDLKLSTSLNPRQAMEMIADHISELAWSNEKSALLDSSVTIDALGPPKLSTEATEEGFHFVPDLSVGFRQLNEGDYDRFWDILLRATMLLLEHSQDAVLLFNGEVIVLQRLGGQLVFNADYPISDDDHWLESRVTLPFERRPLPSPYL